MTLHQVTAPYPIKVHGRTEGQIVKIEDDAQAERLQRSGAIGPKVSAQKAKRLDEERVRALAEEMGAPPAGDDPPDETTTTEE